MVTTVSGLLTKPGIGVWSGTPDGRPPLLGDLAVEAESATGVLDVVETLDGYAGEATVVTYTVTFDGMDPVRTVALCDTADGRRCVALSRGRRSGRGSCRARTSSGVGSGWRAVPSLL